MTIHVTQVEIDVAQGLINSNLYKMSNCYINPVALAMSKAFKVRCLAYPDTLYIGLSEGVITPYHVACILQHALNSYMKPFSFDIEV